MNEYRLLFYWNAGRDAIELLAYDRSELLDQFHFYDLQSGYTPIESIYNYRRALHTTSTQQSGTFSTTSLLTMIHG